MHEEKTFTWLSHWGFERFAPNHVLMAVLVILGVFALTAVARMKLTAVMKTEEAGLIPEARLTYRGFFEVLSEQLYGLTESVLGSHDAPTYFPMIGSLFVFIFVSNILGLIPGVVPSTENLNTTLALGVFVFLYYNYSGLRANGLSYLKHFWGPVSWLGPLMVVIELASHVFRPLSLGLRLRGNIMGDHVVLGVFNGLVPILIPVIFYGLGLFVAFIQSFVFCLMTMVYISLSTSHDH